MEDLVSTGRAVTCRSGRRRAGGATGARRRRQEARDARSLRKHRKLAPPRRHAQRATYPYTLCAATD